MDGRASLTNRLTKSNRLTQVDQGYPIVEPVFARSEMAHILEKLSAASPERTKAGARHILERACREGTIR